MKKILLCLSIIALSVSKNVLSQTYPFRTYSIQDGLSESVVNDILQDNEGYLWFATGYGLNRFDGINFENFFEESGLNHSKILSLFEAKDGKIWIGTAQGVNVFEDDSISTPESLIALSSSEIISIYEDKEGHLWFGTDGNGVWHYIDDSQVILYSTAQGLLSNQVRGIVESENGDIWLGTRGGLTQLKNGNLRTYTVADGLPENRIRDLKIDDQGSILIATRNGLSKFDGNSFQNFGQNNEMIDPKIQTLSIAEDGTIWLGTEGGVSRFRDGVFKNFSSDEGLSNDIVYSSIVDREGDVWFGTFGGGVSLFLGDYFKNYTTDSGLSNDLVTSMVEDEKGTLWIATYGGGMMALNDMGFKYLSVVDGLPDNRIYHLEKDSQDRIWIGMREGLSFLKYGKITTFEENVFPFRKIRHVMEASNGEFWISTEDEGLIRFFETGYEVFDESVGLASNSTRRSIQDRDGNIWVATYGGVSKISSDGIENFSLQEGIPNNGVMSILLDNQGTIWISTFGGIAWFDGVRFVDITDEDGLPGRVAYFISQDGKGNFWVGTNAGIARLDINLFYSENRTEREKAIQVLTREQGLVSNEMNLGAVYEDRNGNFWFGSVEGVSHFNPSAYNGNQVPPRIHISRFIASGSQYMSNGVELTHDKNFIEIDFIGLNFTAPNQVTYEYKMSGIDPEWQRTTLRSAKYPSLPPGEYTFSVHAKNSSGIWSEEIAVVQFKIKSPFWMTWWFLIFIVASVLGIIYLFYRNYRYMKMVDIERMRVRIASDLHDDVGASLTEIALQSDFLQASHVEPEFKNSLNQIGKQCRHVVTSLDDIVWSIDARNDTLGDLTDRMQDYIINVLEPKNFRVVYDFGELKMDNKLPVPVKENLYLIFKEAVNNIAKYSNGDEVIVGMNSKNGEYEFKIHDNGTTGKGTKKTGHGLRNMEMRAQRIGGLFNFEDKNGFTVTLKGKLN
ncbi:MAG: two-component regulator propeller domain-containing protein [Balneolaceae bacterium]